MELKNVATFVKVAECNSFTKAAGHMGYSQATVTAQIKALEQELGVSLFDRIGKRIYLTDAGKRFLPYAIDLLNAKEAALHSIRPAGILTGDLRLCSASSYAAAVLPSILLRFQRTYPGVHIVVKVSDYPEDTVEKLRRDEIDFLVELDAGGAYSSCRSVYKKREDVLFVTYPQNPLLRRTHIALADILDDHLILADHTIGYCAMLEEQVHRKGLTLQPAMELGSVEAIIHMLLNGFGTAFIPAYIAEEYIRDGRLAQIPAGEISVELYAQLLCNKDKWLNPIMEAFAQIFREELG